MWKYFLSILSKILLFFIIPIFICVLFIEFIVVWYRGEILLLSDLLDSFSSLNLWLVWICIISSWWLIIIFRVMKPQLFIISCISWIIILTSIFYIYSRPISGLADIPDSVFALSWVDIHNIPRISPEMCSEIKKITQELDSRSSMLFLSTHPQGTIWRELYKSNPEKTEYINYLLFLNEKFISERKYNSYFISVISMDDKEWIESGKVTKETLFQRLPQEKQDEYTMVEIDRKKRERESSNKWNQYLSSLSWSLDIDKFISVTYSSDDLKKIERLMEIVNTNNIWGNWYCMKMNPQNLADELIPDMSSDLNIERIILQYALIEASVWETEKANKILTLMVENLILKEEHSYTLVWGMMNIAMKSIFFGALGTIKSIGYPEYLLSWIYSKIRTFDETAMMLSSYRWDYYLTSHLFMNTDIPLQKLYIPIVLSGEESSKILKNYYSSAMNMFDPSIPKWKYSYKNHEFEQIDVLWPNSEPTHIKHTFNNPLWRHLLYTFLPSIKSYYKRFLFAEIEKNNILYPVE